MQEPVETIHVYLVKEKDTQQDQPVIESIASDGTATIGTQPLVQQSQPTHGQLVPYLIMAAHLLIVLAAFSIHFYTLLTETATITIMPKQAVVTAHLTLSNVQSRIFPPITLTQSRTIPATGTGHQDATQATGSITLYNAATQEQTIDAGTLFIGVDGQHIVTDETASIPGATPPLEGQAIVQAHAINKGSAGNIRAGDIQGACCRENMFAFNSAFSGGADERKFNIVTQQDMQGVVSSVMPQLTASIQATFQKQVHSGEVLIPNQCSQHIDTDRQVGEEASNVTVTVTTSCIAGAYSSNDLRTKVQQALAQQTAHTRGTEYELSSYLTLSPLHTSIQQGRLVIGGTFEARMIYHFSTHQLTILRQQLAGKTKEQAVALLAHLNGVDHLTVQLGKNGTFPPDPTHIHILFLIVS